MRNRFEAKKKIRFYGAFGYIFLVGLMVLIAACEKKSPLTIVSLSDDKTSSLQSPVIATVREIGAIGKPATVAVRDGGASALIGGNLLWYFGDTIFNPPAVDGTNLRSNTAALANPLQPLVTSEPVDANGAPHPFVPFTPDEQAYYDASGQPDERFALWPGSIIRDANGNGVVFFLKLKVHPGFLNYEFIGAGLANVTPGQTNATRQGKLLFKIPEPTFDNAAVLGSYVYVYGDINMTNNFGVARVPLAQVKTRSAYRFWNGVKWVANVNQTRAILNGIPGEMTVSYNAYLQKYLAIHSGALSPKIFMRTADNPQGPWSAPAEVFTGRTSSSGFNYAAREHPELAQNNGQTIFITYFNPQGFLAGELYLVEVTLQ